MRFVVLAFAFGLAFCTALRLPRVVFAADALFFFAGALARS